MQLSVRTEDFCTSSVVVYILNGETARATGGRSPEHLDAGASARGALCHSRGAVGHELSFLLINYL